MEKLKLYGCKKEKTHNVFYIDKKEIFLKYFIDLLHELGFNKSLTASQLLRPLGDADDNYSARKYSDELYQDKYFYFTNEEFKIDLFFGKERVIISIFSISDNQKKILDMIQNFSEF